MKKMARNHCNPNHERLTHAKLFRPNPGWFLAIILFLTINALASDDGVWNWKQHKSLEEELSDSRYVFVGEVVKAKQVLDSDGFIQGTFYDVQVRELLRGNPTTRVEIYDENSSGRFPIMVGARYLLFAYQGVFQAVDGPRLAIDACGNSAKLTKAGKALKAARKFVAQAILNEPSIRGR